MIIDNAEEATALHWPDVPRLAELAKTQTLGTAMRAWREGLEWTLTSTATKLGISKQMLSEYERGLKLPSIRRTLELAELMGASPAMWLRYRLQDELKALGYGSKGSLNESFNQLAIF